MAKAKKLSPDEQAIKELTTQIRVGMARKGINSAELARLVGEPATTVNGWIRHPDTMNMKKWKKVNAILHLDPTPFNVGAGFVRGGAL